MSISNFWCSVFRLPQRSLDEIESLCSAFLWSGSPNDRNKAKVSWAEVCYPKEKGGLGICRLRDSSRVFALILIWRLFANSGSLWVAWTKSNLLKHKSFWEIKDGTLGSWIWRKLLKLWDQASVFFQWEIRNGDTVSFWWDYWFSQGQLYKLLGAGGPRNLGIRLHGTVSEAADGTNWRLRRCRDQRLRDIISSIYSGPVPCAVAGHDIPLWRHAPNEFKRCFSTSKIWNQLRPTKSQVPWHRTVSFTQQVPRYSFIVWQAIRDRLATGARTRRWGQVQECVFCGEKDETRYHLFFACPYSFTLWMELVRKFLGCKITPDWSRTLVLLQSRQWQLLEKMLLRMVSQATIYSIWRERNCRRHNQGRHLMEFLSRAIRKVVGDRINSLRYTEESKFKDLQARWGSRF